MDIIKSNSTSMTSREIAEIVNSRHDKVKQTIERLSSDNETRKAVISKPPMGDGIKAANGVTEKLYIFSGEQGKRDSIIVVAQLSPEFTARLVDRWQELESKQTPAIPKTYAEALQLAADQARQLEEQAPKVEFVNRLVGRSTLMNATQIAQKHGMSAMKLNKILDEVGGVYSKAVKRSRTFIQSWIDNGYGELKQTQEGHSQPLFTPAGEVRINEILISEGVV